MLFKNVEYQCSVREIISSKSSSPTSSQFSVCARCSISQSINALECFEANLLKSLFFSFIENFVSVEFFIFLLNHLCFENLTVPKGPHVR